jgi:hypothetical protein
MGDDRRGGGQPGSAKPRFEVAGHRRRMRPYRASSDGL